LNTHIHPLSGLFISHGNTISHFVMQNIGIVNAQSILKFADRTTVVSVAPAFHSDVGVALLDFLASVGSAIALVRLLLCLSFLFYAIALCARNLTIYTQLFTPHQ
jgi:hypothetical protein